MKRLLALAVCALCLSSSVSADQGSVSVLNELLRGELSAVETYRQALEKFKTGSRAGELKKFHDQHVTAAETLRNHVVKNGGEPVMTSGAWGTWATAIQGTANVMGETAALKVLKEGEQHGVKEYKELLENENAPAAVKELVRTKLLPQQQEHILSLDRLMTASMNS
ncbi:MAG: DUF2383 domain-containing protein [Deltaproteobacteria bacterium]|nr:DUF2383 domain-containing protein [Deltaproteobacteria bacterium]